MKRRIAVFAVVWAYAACWLWLPFAGYTTVTALHFFPPGYFFALGVLFGIGHEIFASRLKRPFATLVVIPLALEFGHWLYNGNALGFLLGGILAVAILPATLGRPAIANQQNAGYLPGSLQRDRSCHLADSNRLRFHLRRGSAHFSRRHFHGQVDERLRNSHVDRLRACRSEKRPDGSFRAGGHSVLLRRILQREKLPVDESARIRDRFGSIRRKSAAQPLISFPNLLSQTRSGSANSGKWIKSVKNLH